MEHELVFKFIERWSPKQIAWERDNVGLQVGSRLSKTKGVLLTLDISEEAIQTAIKEKCNLVISHHPLFFNPAKSINIDSSQGKIIQAAIKNDITIYSAHTNLDFSKGGVSFALAEKLELQKITFLENAPQTQYKLVTFVPEQYVYQIIEKLADAGAGIIGDYTHCSYKLYGKGTFFGTEATNPAVGEKGKLEEVDEVRLEMIFEKWKIKEVLKALIENHPYEEPAYDIYPLQNKNVNFGFGAMGFLKGKMDLNDFVLFVKKKLKAPSIKYTNGKSKKIYKVGVCGGSGSDLIQQAISNDCDAFVTADIKYHTMMDFADSITLIDAGHYYTEVVILDKLEKELGKFFERERIKIVKFYPKEKIKFVE